MLKMNQWKFYKKKKKKDIDKKNLKVGFKLPIFKKKY
jgi:hypothetical protein